jgi:hypothetical protein
MNFDSCHYVPCLRWKKGEYQAVRELSGRARSTITPLIEVAEPGYDFEKEKAAKSLDEHLAPFAKRVDEYWKGRPCFVDFNWIDPKERLAGGRHPVEFVFGELKARGCVAVPVTGLKRDRAYRRAVEDVISRDKRGLCLRLELGEVGTGDLKGPIDALLSRAIRPNVCDLILDLGAPNFDPVNGFAKLVESVIRRLPYLQDWRTFTLMGTSFPATMAGIKTSPTRVPRSEWLLYRVVAGNLSEMKLRVPSFGDYCINYPRALPMDMRLLKPSASIRYTTEEDWFIVKGPNVRENQFGQYQSHCRTVMNCCDYFGPGFSSGDRYISECAKGVVSTGNLTTWRQVGTNHHLEVVAHGIANFFGASSNSSPSGVVPTE